MEQLTENVVLRNENVGIKIDQTGNVLEMIRYDPYGNVIMKWEWKDAAGNIVNKLSFFREAKDDAVFYNVKREDINFLNGHPGENQYDGYERIIYSDVLTRGKYTKWLYPITGRGREFPLLKFTRFDDTDSTVEYYDEDGKLCFTEDDIAATEYDYLED